MAFLFTLTRHTKLNLLCSALFLLIATTKSVAQYYTSNTITSNTSVNRYMEWVYGGYRFALNIPLKTSAYNYYKALSKRHSNYASYAKEHEGYRYLSQVATKLKVDADELGYKGWRLAEYLTAFVQQNITYTKDPYNYGYDYPKFPIETLVEKKGDCEDSAILLVTLLKLFGFDALLIQVPGHMAVGIACSNCSTYYNFEGEKYAYIETTNPRWEIGSIPPEYKKVSAQLIKTPYLKPIKKEKTPMPQPKKNDCTCEPKKQVKTITIEGRVYTIKPNETIVVKQNGVTVRISN